jgi:vitamin K-dependent gamma-carboxylase
MIFWNNLCACFYTVFYVENDNESFTPNEISLLMDQLQRLLKPVNGNVLGIFRVIFGACMLYQGYYCYDSQLIDNGFLKPYLLFKYNGFEFVECFSRPVMFGFLGAFCAAGLGILTGLFFRVSCVILALVQFYFLMLEKAYYNNHLYLIALLAVLLAFTNADDFVSLKPASKRKYQSIPFWQQFILQAQFCIVYFYGSFVKLKADWLIAKQPLTNMVATFPEQKAMSWLMKMPGAVEVLTYGGLLLDLTAPFLLLYKPTRKWAVIPVLLFHFLNTRIFDDIGVFPYLMALSLVIFFSSDDFSFFGKTPDHTESTLALRPVVKYSLLIYFAFQLLFPLRGYFLPNPMDYTTIGNRFAWRMKADSREVTEMAFYATHPGSLQKLPVDLKVFLNPVQLTHLAQDPRSVHQFAQGLVREGEKQGVKGMIVQGTIKLKYNGRNEEVQMIDPNVDLTHSGYSIWSKIPWVNVPSGL